MEESISTLTEDVIRNLSAPLVSAVIVSAAGNRIAESTSPECMILSVIVTSPFRSKREPGDVVPVLTMQPAQ